MALQVVKAYTLPPGCCLSCGMPRTPAVSTGIDVHQPGMAFDSEVVICHSCVLTMAREVGKYVGYAVVTVAELEEHKTTVAELTAKIVELNDEVTLAYHARNAVLESLGKRPVEDADLFTQLPPEDVPPPKVKS